MVDGNNKYKKILCIQTSAILAETFTFPIDYTKTLIQIDAKKTGVLKMLKQIINNPKEYNVYNGLKPALLRHSVYTMSRIRIYEELRNSNKNNSTGELSLKTKMLFGGIAGGLSQIIASPFDLLKVQYITQKNNKNRTMFSTMKTIISSRGVLGLWKGVTPNVSRAILVNLGELSSYDHSKYLFKKHLNLKDTPLFVASSITSGFVASVCCTPADVIKSRLMQKDSPYRGVLHCLTDTIKKEGLVALYKGFLPIWFRLAPWQFIFWVSHENLRIMAELKDF